MHTIHHRVAALAAPVLALSLLLAAGQPAVADSTPSGSSGAGWLTTQLTGGVVHNDDFGFDDFGLTVDFGLAFAALGTQPAALQSVSGAMATHVHDYTEAPAFGTDIYAGATAKVLRLAQVSGANPRSFGGVDLVARLETLTGANGRIADDTVLPTDPDFANTIGQAFAVEGLGVAGSPEAAAATSFLLAQQCSPGWFRLGFSPAAAADQSCAGAVPAATPDTDVTALAVLALQSRRTSPGVEQAIAKAVAWLRSVQLPDGSFGGGTSTDTPNTNSTGLAAAALGDSCAIDAADRAADWVRSLQVPAGQTGPLAAAVGAIAYDPAAKAAGQTNGITTGSADQWRRATSQAVLGLVWDDSAPATVQLAGPKKYVPAGSQRVLRISGHSAGERICVTGAGQSQRLIGPGVAFSTKVTVPDTTGKTVFSASTGPGVSRVVVKTLAAKKLKLRLGDTLSKGDRHLLRVKGLAKREKVKVFVDGKLVTKAKASRKGVLHVRILAAGRPGTVHKVKVVGQFDNRKGKTTFRVVR